jgi:hypothetical protein
MSLLDSCMQKGVRVAGSCRCVTNPCCGLRVDCHYGSAVSMVMGCKGAAMRKSASEAVVHSSAGVPKHTNKLAQQDSSDKKGDRCKWSAAEPHTLTPQPRNVRTTICTVRTLLAPGCEVTVGAVRVAAMAARAQ